MIWKASFLLCLASCVLSDRRPAVSEQKIARFHHGDLKHIGEYVPEHHEIYAWAYPSYEFSYHVDDPHTHDFKGQHEMRDGDKVTGKYWLLQPDGRKRTVKYSSDHKQGFQAEVNYIPHEGHHPVIKEYHGYPDHQHHSEHKPKHSERKGDDMMKKEDEDHDEKHHDIDEKRDHNDEHGHKKQSWGWIKPRIHHEHHDRIDDIGERRNRHGHSEHWKHGVLVGWMEGRDRHDHHIERDEHHRYRDEHHRYRDDHHKYKDDDYRGEDRRSDHDDRRGQHSYHRPIMSFKPLVPYGQRLH